MEVISAAKVARQIYTRLGSPGVKIALSGRVSPQRTRIRRMSLTVRASMRKKKLTPLETMAKVGQTVARLQSTMDVLNQRDPMVQMTVHPLPLVGS